MKNFIFQCIFLCCGIFNVQSQSESIEKVVNSYLSAIENKDYQLLAKYLDNTLYDDMTPADLAEGLIDAMTGEDAMPMEISNASFVESGNVINSDGNKYAPVKISYTIQVPFMGEFTEMVVENLQLSHGEDNVVRDDENEIITASIEEYIIARFDEDQNTWKLFTPQMMYFSDSMNEELQYNIMEQISVWKLDRMPN